MRTVLTSIALWATLGPATLGLTACSSTGSLDVWPGSGLGRVEKECTERPDPVTLPGTQVPIYECVEEPIYEDRYTPIYGQKTVDVFQKRRRPVTIPVKDWCTGCERDVTLWCVNEDVRVGVERVDSCIGYKTERVQVGTCRKQVIVGWRTLQPAPCPCPPGQ